MVEITQAEGLPLVPLRIPSKKVNCNTFVEVQCGDEKFTTDTFRHTQKPTYNKVHTFTLNESISDSTPPLKVKVIHAGRTGKTTIGVVDVPLGALRGTKLENKFYQLKGQSGKAGRISMQLKYTDPNAGAGGGGGGAAAGADGDGGSTSVSGDGGGGMDVAGTEEEMALRKKNESLVKRDMGTLSSKPADYQIRVKVIQVGAIMSLHSLLVTTDHSHN
jgi:hypothetical protein